MRTPLLPRDLTIPEPGSRTAYDVLSRAIARLVAEVRPALAERGLGADARAPLETGALASVLRRPNAGALARTMRSASPAVRDELLTELAALVAFELSSAGALAHEVRLDRAPPRIVSLAQRCVVDVSGHRREPYHPIAGDIVLALEDNNPLASFEAHPDKEGNAIDLGGRAPAEWTRALADALAIVEAHLPDVRREMDLYIAQIVPVGFDREKHLSASYREAIGTIYLTLHPSVMTMAEALVHEFSHNKINALFEIDDVLENAFSPLYPSPVRPDPRPLHGVLLAVHAFLPIARLYERMIEARHPLSERADFHARYREIIAINHDGASIVLPNARPTPAGRALLDEIARWDAHYAKLG